MPVSNFPLHTAAPRENLQRFERGAHGAAMIDPRAERAWRALPLRLCVSHDEWHHAKTDRSSQSDGQQREQHLDI